MTASEGLRDGPIRRSCNRSAWTVLDDARAAAARGGPRTARPAGRRVETMEALYRERTGLSARDALATYDDGAGARAVRRSRGSSRSSAREDRRLRVSKGGVGRHRGASPSSSDPDLTRSCRDATLRRWWRRPTGRSAAQAADDQLQMMKRCGRVRGRRRGPAFLALADDRVVHDGRLASRSTAAAWPPRGPDVLTASEFGTYWQTHPAAARRRQIRCLAAEFVAIARVWRVVRACSVTRCSTSGTFRARIFGVADHRRARLGAWHLRRSRRHGFARLRCGLGVFARVTGR